MCAMEKVLIVDDERQLRELLAKMVALEGFDVSQADSCRAAASQIRRAAPDIVICDVKLPDGNGVEFVPEIKKLLPDSEVILLTAFGNIPDGVQAMKNGAFDYITKGDDTDKILPLIFRAAERVRARRASSKNAPDEPFDAIVGSSDELRAAVTLAKKVCVTNSPVLLTGETGTGKEVFARAIHLGSPRAKKPFVAINCSAFGKDILESELFGYKAGAFTGAVKDKKGFFEEADGGTLFLDEIGEMPTPLQAKLLRVLESGEFVKVGDTKPMKCDVRIISATNRNLDDEMREGRFRSDLFFRISVFSISLPPLSERPSDIPEYAAIFVRSFAEKFKKNADSIDPKYFEVLKHHKWRGNVRELKNVVERSMIIFDGGVLRAEDLPLEIQNAAAGEDGGSPASLDESLAEVEKRHIKRMLEFTGGNKTEAAKRLGIGVATIYRKISEYGL